MKKASSLDIQAFRDSMSSVTLRKRNRSDDLLLVALLAVTALAIILARRGIIGRDDLDQIFSAPETVAAYIQAAFKIGQSLKCASQDRVTVVECNPMLNYGRYAMRFRPIVQASSRCSDRSPHRPDGRNISG